MTRFLALALAVLQLTSARQAAEAPLAITNVTLIDGTGAAPPPGTTVLVRDGRIAAIGTATAVRVPAEARRIDGARRFLIPGLWDMHVHLTTQPEAHLAADFVLPMLVAHGVVGVRDMGGDLERVLELRAAVAAGRLRGPTIVTPGPFVDGPQEASPFVRQVKDAAEAGAAVRELKARGVDFIKVQAALSVEAWRAVAAESGRSGISFAGHVPEAVSASEVVGSGQRSIEHVSPALPGDAGILLACSSREEELRQELQAIADAAQAPDASREELRRRRRVLQQALLDGYDAARAAALFAAMKAKDVASVPTLIWSQTFLPRGPDDLAADLPFRLIPEAMRERWAAQRRKYVEAATPEALALNARLATRSVTLVRALHEAGVRILAGSDSFDGYVLPGFALHQELELLVSAGLTPLQALQAATQDAARFLGQSDRGTIEVGKRADLVLLDANPLQDIRHTRRINAVMLNGAFLGRADLMLPGNLQ